MTEIATSRAKPAGLIVKKGEQNCKPVTKKIETVANCYPGRFVKKGTTDHEVLVNTDENPPIGVLGYEHTHAAYRPATVDTIYVVNDEAAVLQGEDFEFVASLYTNEEVSMGDQLVAAATGCVKQWTSGDTIIVGTALESVTTTSAVADILIRRHG